MTSRLAQRIRAARKTTPHTQLTAARALRIGRSSLIQYESGRVTPKLDTAAALAVLYDQSLDWIACVPGAERSRLDAGRCQSVSATPQRLRDARAKSGLTQEDVAAATGVARSSLSQYESGRVIPKLDTAARLAVLYDQSLDWIACVPGATRRGCRAA